MCQYFKFDTRLCPILELVSFLVQQSNSAPYTYNNKLPVLLGPKSFYVTICDCANSNKGTGTLNIHVNMINTITNIYVV